MDEAHFARVWITFSVFLPFRKDNSWPGISRNGGPQSEHVVSLGFQLLFIFLVQIHFWPQNLLLNFATFFLFTICLQFHFFHPLSALVEHPWTVYCPCNSCSHLMVRAGFAWMGKSMRLELCVICLWRAHPSAKQLSGDTQKIPISRYSSRVPAFDPALLGTSQEGLDCSQKQRPGSGGIHMFPLGHFKIR